MQRTIPDRAQWDPRTTAYLGMTIAPEGTMPQATLKGDLSAFGPTHAIE